jgi:hypothetical protein
MHVAGQHDSPAAKSSYSRHVQEAMIGFAPISAASGHRAALRGLTGFGING